MAGCNEQVELNSNPKEWARSRQRLKYDKRRDCRKSHPNGQTTRKAIISQDENNSTEVDDALDNYRPCRWNKSVYHAPNPIETYFNKLNPTASFIQENLLNIVKETNPNEILYSPNQNCTKYSWNRNADTIHLIYKYTNEQYNDAIIWQKKYLSKIRKMEKEIGGKASYVGKEINGNGSGNENGSENKSNNYIPPTINEPKIGRAGHMRFRTLDSTPKHPKTEFVLIDFGSNRWVTGFSTAFEWYKVKRKTKEGKNYIEWVLNAIGNYTITIGCDNDELANNISKFHTNKKELVMQEKNGDKKKNNKDKTNDNNKKKKNTNKNGNRSHRNNNNNKNRNSKNNKNSKKSKNGENMITEGQAYLNRLEKSKNIVWECLGRFNGMLDGYYVNYNKEIHVEKTFVVGDGSKSKSRSRSSSRGNCKSSKSNNGGNSIKNGRLCRYIKFTPNSNERHKYICLTAYGTRVNLLGKPISNNGSKTSQMIEKLNYQKRRRRNDDRDDEKLGIDSVNYNENGNINTSIYDNDNDREGEGIEAMSNILRINSTSKIIQEHDEGDGDDDDEHIVRISFGVRDKASEAKYSEVRSAWDDNTHWRRQYANEETRKYRIQEERYLENLRTLSKYNGAQIVADCA